MIYYEYDDIMVLYSSVHVVVHVVCMHTPSSFLFYGVIYFLPLSERNILGNQWKYKSNISNTKIKLIRFSSLKWPVEIIAMRSTKNNSIKCALQKDATCLLVLKFWTELCQGSYCSRRKPRVQKQLMCNSQAQGNKEMHWHSWLARAVPKSRIWNFWPMLTYLGQILQEILKNALRFQSTKCHYLTSSVVSRGRLERLVPRLFSFLCEARPTYASLSLCLVTSHSSPARYLALRTTWSNASEHFGPPFARTSCISATLNPCHKVLKTLTVLTFAKKNIIKKL